MRLLLSARLCAGRRLSADRRIVVFTPRNAGSDRSDGRSDESSTVERYPSWRFKPFRESLPMATTTIEARCNAPNSLSLCSFETRS